MIRRISLFSLTLLFSAGWSTGCTFRVLGVPVEELPGADGGGSKDGGTDGPLVIPDLTPTGDGPIDPPDLPIVDGIVVNDLATESDLVGVTLDFSGVTLDLTAPPDLVTTPPDMTAPIVPSHVGASYLNPGAAALGSVTEIDTMNLLIRINGGTPQFPPANTSLVIDPTTSLAVFSVGAFAIDKDLTVIGNRGLVIVASGGIVVSAILRANGVQAVGGPGAISGGSGAGGNGGQGCTNRESGGGGAGHLTDGAIGGSAQVAGTCPAGGAAGLAYGPLQSDFLGGSNGGTGGRRSDDCTTSVGGGGGGAVQLTSSVSITVTGTGGINAGGGGGGAGCNQPRKTAGGGGGSGGTIFLEAPTIDIQGKVAANGGGGGSGGGDAGGGNVGQDGQLSGNAASGGAANGNSSGVGGSGGAEMSLPQQPPGARNAGGGGGAAGYIYLRTRGTTPTEGSSSVVSPNGIVDQTL